MKYKEVDSVKEYAYYNGVVLEAGVMMNGGVNEYLKVSVMNRDPENTPSEIFKEEYRINLTPRKGKILPHAAGLGPEDEPGSYGILSNHKLSKIKLDDDKFSIFITELADVSNSVLEKMRNNPNYSSVVNPRG